MTPPPPPRQFPVQVTSPLWATGRRRKAVRRLGLPSFGESGDESRQAPGEGASNPFSALLPWLMSISATTDKKDSSEPKATRYLVAKVLPTLTMRVVERIWNLEFVEMEDLLPAPRSLRLGYIPQISPGQPSRGFEPLPGPPATQGAAQGNRHHDVGQMLLTVYGSASQEGTSYGPQHGGPPAYSPAPPPEGYPTLRLAGIRHMELGSLRKQGLEGRGSVAVRGMPSGAAADGRSVRHSRRGTPPQREKGRGPWNQRARRTRSRTLKGPKRQYAAYSIWPRGVAHTGESASSCIVAPTVGR